MGYTPISAQEFLSSDGLTQWSVEGGKARAEFAGPSFSVAGQFVAAISVAADRQDHHPDLALRYPGQVSVTLHTHVTGGLSTHDTALARTIEELAAALGVAHRQT